MSAESRIARHGDAHADRDNVHASPRNRIEREDPTR